jgi:hypothetical protein
MVTGEDHRLSKIGIIHQTEFAQSVEHGLANFFGNSPSPQGTGQFKPGPWPRGEQSQANTLCLRSQADHIAILVVVHSRLVGGGAAFRHGISGVAVRTYVIRVSHQKSTGVGTV